jgi:hypothetical protein
MCRNIGGNVPSVPDSPLGLILPKINLGTGTRIVTQMDRDMVGDPVDRETRTQETPITAMTRPMAIFPGSR